LDLTEAPETQFAYVRDPIELGFGGIGAKPPAKAHPGASG
jgi:hypothetical protein